MSKHTVAGKLTVTSVEDEEFETQFMSGSDQIDEPV